MTLTSYPGERATLRGQLRFGYKADGSVAENMDLDGRNDDDLLGPLIYADDAILRGNDITNHHQGICVVVSALLERAADPRRRDREQRDP